MSTLTEVETMSLFTTPDAIPLDRPEHTKYYVGKTEVPGVTRISGRETGYLTAWANELGRRGIDINKYLIHTANIGTLVHERICAYEKGEPGYEFTAMDSKYHHTVDRCFKLYQQFRADYGYEPELSEKSLVCNRHLYGGTLDSYGKLGDSKILIDVKTSDDIFDSGRLQLAALRTMLRENGYHVDRVFILRLPREGKKYYFNEVYPIHRYFDRFLHHLSNYYIERAQIADNKTEQLKLLQKERKVWLKEQKLNK